MADIEFLTALEIAIKALEQERSRSAEITQYRDDCEKLMEENERLKKALKQESKWIPVSERLPEKDDLYLICYDDGGLDLVYFSKGDFYYSGVIAWIPTPKPYKAESEE